MRETMTKKCPVCKREADVKYFPFCSPRCADVDLGRWFSESYVVPTDEPPDPERFDEGNS